MAGVADIVQILSLLICKENLEVWVDPPARGFSSDNIVCEIQHLLYVCIEVKIEVDNKYTYRMIALERVSYAIDDKCADDSKKKVLNKVTYMVLASLSLYQSPPDVVSKRFVTYKSH